MPSADVVPYAFETRVMSALRASGATDSGGWAFTGLWRAGLVCLVIAMLTTGLDFAVEDPIVDRGVEESLALAILPADVLEQEL